MNFRNRAKAEFLRSGIEMNKVVGAMVADHAAKGTLKSGATAKAALQAFEECSSKALGQVLDEAAKLIQHRGPKWRRATNQIRAALDEHAAGAPEALRPTMKLAGADTGAAAEAVNERLGDISGRLRYQLQEFADGWTAPVGKTWSERHPVLLKVLFALFGSALTLAATYATGVLDLSRNEAPVTKQ